MRLIINVRAVIRFMLSAVFLITISTDAALAATSSGIDTPAGVTSLPLAVDGVSILTLTNTPSNSAVFLGSIVSSSSDFQLGYAGNGVVGHTVNNYGVWGYATGAGAGVVGQTVDSDGVLGTATGGGAGVVGYAANNWGGVMTGPSYGLYASGGTWAGYFNGPVYTNSITTGGITFSDGTHLTTAPPLFGGMFTMTYQQFCTLGGCSALSNPGCSVGNALNGGGCSCPSWAPNAYVGQSSNGGCSGNIFGCTTTFSYAEYCSSI